MGRNDHTEDNCESLPVSGFNSSDILVDPYTYDYWKVSSLCGIGSGTNGLAWILP